jgi:hypothetical protein
LVESGNAAEFRARHAESFFPGDPDGFRAYIAENPANLSFQTVLAAKLGLDWG